MILPIGITLWTIVVIVLALWAWRQDRAAILRIMRQARAPMLGLDIQAKSGSTWLFYAIMIELEEQGKVRYFTSVGSVVGCGWYELTEDGRAGQ